MTSAPQVIISNLADEGRRVLSQWRALVYLRRASEIIPVDERRWSNTPQTTADVVPLFRRMQTTGQIESLPNAPGCYIVMDPFAQLLPVRELELLLELNPFAVVSHYTALVHHGFTHNRPNLMTAWPGEQGWTLPLNTEPGDWVDIASPIARRPRRILTQRMEWFQRFNDFSFGVIDAHDGPIPIRVTDQERTLIDSLQWPEYAGGIVSAFRAWELGRNFIDIDTIVRYTESYGIGILKQRVGYVAEAVGFTHPQFDTWASQSVRGGSSRLVGSTSFESRYSERWNLSLNAPIEELTSA